MGSNPLKTAKEPPVVRQTKGAEVAPAGWQPGDKVLRPGPDLVGNVWKVWSPGEGD